MIKLNHSSKLFLFSTAMIAALAGCSDSSNDTSSEDTDATVDSSTEEQIVIEHAFGETTLDSVPERIATVQWGNQDVALALGVVPVGFSAANFGVQDDSGLLPWTAEKLEELGEEDPNVYQDTDGLDFEAIADSQPDVILAAYSGITEEDYNLLSEIAPVVAYPTSPWTTSWRDHVLMNAEGMGLKEQGEQLIEDTEQLIDEKLAEYPEIEGKTVAWVNFSATDTSNLHLYTPADTRVAFLTEELNMEFPQEIKDELPNEEDFSLSLSAENADILNNVDVILGYGDDELFEALQKDARLGQIPAIERGSVAFINGGSELGAAGTPNPLSIAYTIDEYLELIGDALNQAEE
ncbi:iron-siderophore ABC transporter substrate-binding protein [Shouchella lehensis]|uniref:Iron-siderophore ABC transporter substrate-binding protein n=1 Tax=Shouchella lehensis TaxID=300825 RepID=A0A4Y7WJD3_9BACI|nr:iron-siderophore ABC transporter substrate-binding protein [Shouchella lehensis]MBG9785979.1 iron ABC transporter permease [Shouchella lehensis]TES48459.1 iron-siderophore ABC transporter substrate-binding protein [Shouchella lehensis]